MPRRWFVKGSLALLLLLGLVVSGAYAYLRQSLPKVKGEISLGTARAPVEVLRDAYGIPHIFAASVDDAYFALGFVHAHDRLWQMEMSRRVAAGRLAEILGAAALETDRFLRVLGVRRAAEANLERLDEPARRILEAYSDGVNAFLRTRPVLPLEFWLTGVRPEPWTAADSIAWTKMMAWDLGGNWRAELLRLRLAQTLPSARIAEFLPANPGEPEPRLPELKDLYGSLSARLRALALFHGAAAEAPVGSNNWVVSGARSETGKPLLANDPHLGLTAPPVWYFAHLSAPGFDAIGATLPGVPGIVVGRNDRIAWGFTNTGPDVQDLYLEKVDDSGRYLAPDGPRAFQAHEETIAVKGGGAERLVVRRTRHGPVISDVLPAGAAAGVPRGHVLSMAWTALAEDDLSVLGALGLAHARDWASFLDAAAKFHAPQQNIVYADVDGNIGFVAAGRVPVRKRANDLRGLAPAPGWDPRYDWDGYVPFTELPRSFNPASHAIVTANNRIVADGYPHHLTFEWQPAYRASRIQSLLDARNKHSLGSFATMQRDVVSLAVRELLPLFLERVQKGRHEEVLQRLAAWDGTMAADRPEPLVFVAWWREFGRRLYADELGDAFVRNWAARPVFVANALRGRGELWCDDIGTPAKETCPDLLTAALDAAVEGLRARYGADPERWRWGEAHVAHHAHRPFSRVAWLAPFFDIRVPTPGDAFSVNAGRSDFGDEQAPFASRHAASLRALYDLADPQASLFIHSGGQSGNPLSSHYRSFTQAWARGDYVPMVTERARIERAGAQRLVLRPDGGER